MKILVLHSDVPPGAPPDEMDTLIAADAVASALTSRGYETVQAPFFAVRLRALLETEKPDLVFNLVEGINGKGHLAHIAPRLLEQIGMAYTGMRPDGLILTSDKPRSKQLLRDAGLPTPDWCEPPHWHGLEPGRWIVKCAEEDASLGLDDDAVVEAPEVSARADLCAERFGGRWFAERFVDGREFNITILERDGKPHILPLAEMVFESWPVERPRIVGYDAKWDEASPAGQLMLRRFGLEEEDPALAGHLTLLCEDAWHLFQCRGAARIDFRVGADGVPQILEINPNPGIAPDSGLVAAAHHAGLSYADLVEGLVREAMR
ncbi:D-alanine-D-alanine ligase [Rhizomicrobium palustre]|uniref:D-alanine--D-alanine ligase n=1 Tax=Rhizomicrobium palustre TaxID=189966 RepID=A0A846MUY7_9PROT|nr:D-alanine--D-alanine ligase [Rhizomicrobium palustre]NIK87254.1 D-alanine-D-alanine ligase [Rhizomicrobium palustre]